MLPIYIHMDGGQLEFLEWLPINERTARPYSRYIHLTIPNAALWKVKEEYYQTLNHELVIVKKNYQRSY